MADPNLQVTGGGGGSTKIFFGPSGLVLVENQGGGAAPGPSPGSVTLKYARRLENLFKPRMRFFSSMIFCQQTSEPQPENFLLFSSLQHSSVNNSNKVHFCLCRWTAVVKSPVSETTFFQTTKEDWPILYFICGRNASGCKMAKICSKICLSKVINKIFQICLVIFLAVSESSLWWSNY